jgi:hypothetical protein
MIDHFFRWPHMDRKKSGQGHDPKKLFGPSTEKKMRKKRKQDI